MHSQIIKFLVLIIFFISSCSENKKKHLFILSGQSNMVLLNEKETFIPMLEKKFGKNMILVVKDAKGGEPIRRWYKKWNEKSKENNNLNPINEYGKDSIGNLYDKLITKVKKTTIDKKIESISFIWMQGERDARENLAQYYEKGLFGLYDQLSKDLKRENINFIIGRINDFDLKNLNYKHWTKIREIQVKFAESNDKFSWINTDDLNDGYNKKGDSINNDVHMSVEGYKTLGKRFAEKAIELIINNN